MRFYKGGPTADEGAAEAAEDNTKNKVDMEANGDTNLQGALTRLVEGVQGAIGVAVVDMDGGFTLGTAGTAGNDEIDLELAGAGCLDVVQAKIRLLQQLGIEDEIEDILITLGKQYHLIRRLGSNTTLYLYLAIARDRGNLGLARHQLRFLEAELDIYIR